MAAIVIYFDVEDVDPRLVDPHEVAEYLLSLHDVEARAGNARFSIAGEFPSAEWAD